MTVAEMQERMTSREMSEWQAFDRIDPIGDERQDYGSALVAWMVASAFSGKGARPKLEDFMPKWEKRVQGQTQEEMTAAIMAWANQHNAALKGKEKRRGSDDRSAGHQAEQ